MPFSDVHLHIQLPAARALLKFCRDHGRDGGPSMVDLEACVAALERSDVDSAVAAYRLIPLGGMMRFDDWWPPVVFDHETPEYVTTVFEALCREWSWAMRLSCDGG